MDNLPAELELSHLSATIVAELAAGLSTATAIREKYEISDEQWERLKSNRVFRGMLKEAFERLGGDTNAGRRITIKAEIALEDSIPVLYEVAHDKDIPTMARLKAIEQMESLTGRKAKEAGGGGPGGSGFQINIQIDSGNQQPQTVTIDAPALPPPEAEAA